MSRTYYTHIIDTFMKFGFDYDELEIALNDEIIDKKNARKGKSYKRVTADSIRKAHTDKDRGNPPRHVSAADFHQVYELRVHLNLHADFAEELCSALEKHGIFPEEFADDKRFIDGTDEFSEKVFKKLFLHLFELDKKSKRPSAKEETKPPYVIRNKDSAALLPSNTDIALKFFSNGGRDLFEMDSETFKTKSEKLSLVFKDVANLEFLPGADSFTAEPEQLLSRLSSYIVDETEKGTSEILKIEGPLGSYKNKIMQYLFIDIDRNAKEILPLYIDLSYFEKLADEGKTVTEQTILEGFNETIGKVTALIKKFPGRKPLLFLCGIRDFYPCEESLYYSVSATVQKLGCPMVVCMDTDFTVADRRRYEMGKHPLVSENYNAYLRIRSVNLQMKDKSIEFIKNCIDTFEVKPDGKIKAEEIYQRLVDMKFYTVDAYWLVYMLKVNLAFLFRRNVDIYSLYESICKKFLPFNITVRDAAEYAFEFEFGTKVRANSEYRFDMRWRLMRKHRSILDFLIANHFIRLLSDINLRDGSRKEIKDKLRFFNMIIQKSITRFIAPVISTDDKLQHQIMIIAEEYYDDLYDSGKCELAFWMARLNDATRQERCLRLLQDYGKKELDRYLSKSFKDDSDKYRTAFLIRSIHMSLIYMNDEEASRYYLSSLINDKTANMVNRGFHLEYYGDKPYVASEKILDFKDDITKGEAAFAVLCLSLDKSAKKHVPVSYFALTEIMTLCSLIQARIQHRPDSVRPFDVTPYINKCKKYLTWALSDRLTRKLSDVNVYLSWMSELLAKADSTPDKKLPLHYQASAFNSFYKVSDVLRTGWVELGIPVPENVSSHIYSCWLMGMLHLPTTCKKNGYCKDKILKLILIHDLGESETGDIVRREKQLDAEGYEMRENMVMQSLFAAGTFPDAEDVTEYKELWNLWVREGKKLRQGESADLIDINYLVAKDIDNIQAVYQFCNYYLKHPGILSEDDADYWLSDIYRLETDIGKNMADKLILNNPAYKEIVDGYLSRENEV